MFWLVGVAESFSQRAEVFGGVAVTVWVETPAARSIEGAGAPSPFHHFVENLMGLPAALGIEVNADDVEIERRWKTQGLSGILCARPWKGENHHMAIEN
jgi:hypothetical protein